jgi:UDP-2,3-diacylglucosamine pyrophosphatase LpxH
MSPISRMRQLHYRTIWISDVHLGNRECKAKFLLDFLRSTECTYLYLVGDIIDLWAMRRALYWPPEHNEVIRAVLEKAKNGTQVVYIPGNHDDRFRDYVGMHFGNVEIRARHVHVTANGRRLLVLHGDEFDSVMRYSRLLAHLGDRAYHALLRLNRLVNYVRRRLGFPYWSISAYLKHKVKNAVNIISDFEHAIAREAGDSHVDGLVCGHIHHAEMTTINDVLYCNDGDWVESCTALVESHDGALHLVHWADKQQTVKSSGIVDDRRSSRIA